MYSLLARLIDSPLIKGALNVPIAKVVVPTQPLFNQHYFHHACATPLTTLLLETEQLNSKTSKEQLKERYQRLQQSAQQLRTLFHLCYANDTKGYFSVSHFLQEIQLKISVLQTSAVKVVSEVENTAQLFGSQTLLVEALFCVIKNALESYIEPSQKVVIVTVKQKNDTIIIDVQDYGMGMTPLAVFLSQFSGVSYKKSGTGLGVSFARRVAKECFGGFVSIKSTKGVGTKVTFSLPTHSPGTHSL